MFMKKTLVLLVIASLITSVYAYGAGDAIELDLMRIGTENPETVFWHEVISAFEAENPGIKVNYDDTDTSNEKLNVRFQAGDSPDIIGQGIMSVAARAESGQYQPIDKYFANWEGKDDIMPSMLANGTYKGQVYGLAYAATPYIFAYRKDMFEAAGLDPEAPPTTWEQLAEYARKLTVVENGEITTAGFVFPIMGGNLVEYDTFVFGTGGRFLDEELNPTLNTQAGLKAFEFLASFLPEVNIPYNNSEANPFTKGQAAMTLVNNVSLRAMLNDPEYEGKVGIAFPPTNGEKATFCGCNMLFIGCDCEYPDEAFKFIEFAVSSDVVLKRASDLNVPVVRLSLVDEYAAMDPLNAVRAECVEFGIGMPRVTWAQLFQATRNEMVQNVLIAEMDPGEALAKAQEDLEFEIDF
jgi:ABC-type glycerol-3-phosphate transport system substrate-binding protein